MSIETKSGQNKISVYIENPYYIREQQYHRTVAYQLRTVEVLNPALRVSGRMEVKAEFELCLARLVNRNEITHTVTHDIRILYPSRFGGGRVCPTLLLVLI